MTLLQIYYLLEVAKIGSMNKASETLFISQPTLTSNIKELEEEVGIRIFDRSNKGVKLTAEGSVFLARAERVYQEYEHLLADYKGKRRARKKFGVSSQHYSFVVDAFIETAQEFDLSDYALTIRETRTGDIIQDLISGKSEIGVLYRSEFNQKAIRKLLADNHLLFYPLAKQSIHVYLWSGHPLAGKTTIQFSELEPYICLSFEQGERDSAFLAEEVLIEREYSRQIKISDRATGLNLLRSLNAFMLCSGILSEHLDGVDYVVVPLEGEKEQELEVGYVVQEGRELSAPGELFLEKLKLQVGQGH